jgi:hypothetical protein
MLLRQCHAWVKLGFPAPTPRKCLIGAVPIGPNHFAALVAIFWISRGSDPSSVAFR